MKTLLTLALLFACCLPGRPTLAMEFAAPEGEVVLTIVGAIEQFNQGDTLALDMAMIEQFPAVSFSTGTPWTDRKSKWTGVKLDDLFTAIGAKQVRFTASALDDYVINFDGVDVKKYPIIIAYKQDDEYMSARDLGPLWIMFPFDDYEELDTQSNRVLSVWQLLKLEVF